jgi:hypothetical protein
MVSLDDPETFSKTLMAWFERFCGPDALRHIFLTSLQSLGSSLFTDESQEKVRACVSCYSMCAQASVYFV